MIDMNGDGYPDIVQNEAILYTNTLGGISGEKLQGIGNIVSKNEGSAVGVGSAPIVSMSMTIAQAAGWTKTASNIKSISDALGGLSVSMSKPKNRDWSEESFTDVNGDGLPDKILSDNTVRLNLGYAFTDPVDWQIDAVQTGEGTSHNLGGGASSKEKDIAQKAKFFDKASSSFSGGLSIVTTTNGEQYNPKSVIRDFSCKKSDYSRLFHLYSIYILTQYASFTLFQDKMKAKFSNDRFGIT